MMLHGFPISTKLPDDLGIGERFWYWRGASGRNYIHSIYAADVCPPLPGAVFIAVRKTFGCREALEIGRFPSFLDHPLSVSAAAIHGFSGIDEFHVHLLARNDADARSVLDDLKSAASMPTPSPAVSLHRAEMRQLSFSLA